MRTVVMGSFVILVSLLIGLGDATLHQCGGFLGTPCPEGYVCVDQPNDDCNEPGDPAVSNDCMGYCQVRVDCNADQACGTAQHCVDFPFDDCNPTDGDRNCATFCAFETPCDPTAACAEIWAPVCGSDGVTYSNECSMNLERCIDPRLEKVMDDQCPGGKVCTTVYEPVCGSNMKTYENECMWSNAHDVDSTIEKVADMSCDDYRNAQAANAQNSGTTGGMNSSSKVGLILGLIGGFIILATFVFVAARRYLFKKHAKTQTGSPSEIPQSARYAEMDDDSVR